MGEVIGFPQRERRDEPGSAPDSEPEPLWREAVGRLLREVRHEQERTLADVAQEAGVSTQYLSEIERGRKEPSSEILGAVAGALGLRLVDLTSRLTRSLSSRPRISSRPSGPLALAA
jgi:transcriptional regulator with XRE-family HTH domain